MTTLKTEERIRRLKRLLALAEHERALRGWRGGPDAERVRSLAERAWRLELRLLEHEHEQEEAQ